MDDSTGDVSVTNSATLPTGGAYSSSALTAEDLGKNLWWVVLVALLATFLVFLLYYFIVLKKRPPPVAKTSDAMWI